LFLLPIEEDNPTRNSAYAVWALIGLNVAAFLGMVVFGSADWLLAYGFRAIEPSGQALITSMFLHVGVLHLLGNMFFLLTFGDNVEDMTGPVKFVLAYVLAGLFATGAHALTTSHPHIPLVGASGAVSGVVGMYLVLFPRAPFHTHLVLGWWRLGGFRSTAALATGAWFGQQLLLAGMSSWSGVPILGIAFWAHVGGFSAGIVLGFVFGRLAFGSGRLTARCSRRAARVRWADTEQL
jgi:membrane associated rhomboid family serine protease